VFTLSYVNFTHQLANQVHQRGTRGSVGEPSPSKGHVAKKKYRAHACCIQLNQSLHNTYFVNSGCTFTPAQMAVDGAPPFLSDTRTLHYSISRRGGTPPIASVLNSFLTETFCLQNCYHHQIVTSVPSCSSAIPEDSYGQLV